MFDNSGYKGGGEILEYIRLLGQGENGGLRYMDTSLMMQYLMLTVAKVVICILIAYVALKVCKGVLNIRGRKGYRAIDRELGAIYRNRRISSRRSAIYEFVLAITELMRHTPFKISQSYNTQLTYVLSRAGVRLPGKESEMTGEQFIAVLRILQIVGCTLGIVIGIFTNPFVCIVIVFAVIFGGNFIPMTIIEGTARAKDREIENEFFDMYIMVHYSLMSKSNAPISSILKSYGRVTDSEEVGRFIDSCVYTLDTYGEYLGCQKIMEKYKELASVSKLMRIIKQVNEGADVEAELAGFREELFNKRVYLLEQRSDKLIAKVRASINSLMPILIQAILSAASVYLEDMTALSSFF